MRDLTQETVRHALKPGPSSHSAQDDQCGSPGRRRGWSPASGSARNRTHRAARRLRSMRAASSIAHRKSGERSSEMLTFPERSAGESPPVGGRSTFFATRSRTTSSRPLRPRSQTDLSACAARCWLRKTRVRGGRTRGDADAKLDSAGHLAEPQPKRAYGG